MSSEWIHRHFIFVPTSSLEAAIQVAIRVVAPGYEPFVPDPEFPDQVGPEYPESKTFSVQLSSNGLGSPTFWACNTAATEDMRIRMAQAISEGLIAGVVFYRLDVLTEKLIQTNDLNCFSFINKKFTFQDAMDSLGLKRIGG